MIKQEIITFANKKHNQKAQRKKNARDTNRRDIKIGILFYVAENNGAHFPIVISWLPKKSLAGQRVNDRLIRFDWFLLCFACAYIGCVRIWRESRIEFLGIILLSYVPNISRRIELTTTFIIPYSQIYGRCWIQYAHAFCFFSFVLLLSQPTRFSDTFCMDQTKNMSKIFQLNLKILSMFGCLCE